jgi:hypothetical protein
MVCFILWVRKIAEGKEEESLLVVVVVVGTVFVGGLFALTTGHF